MSFLGLERPRIDTPMGQALECALGLLKRVGFFSMFINLLTLTSSIYMMQVYDRVLGSRSEATLLALTLLIVFLFIVMGLLDHARARVMARVGAAFQSRLDRRVFEAAMRRAQASKPATSCRARSNTRPAFFSSCRGMMKSRRKAATSDRATAPSALASFAPSEMTAMVKATDFSGGVAGRLAPMIAASRSAIRRQKLRGFGSSGQV